MPPTVHSKRIEKPDGMSLTWKPRLVKTPTPTMSATTIATATSNETVDPPLPVSRPDKAASPASDAAISVHAFGASRPGFASWCRLGPAISSNANKGLNQNPDSVLKYQNRTRRPVEHRQQCENKKASPTIRTRFRVKNHGSG